MVQYQVGALQAIAKAQGMSVRHVKPHGAMYNMAGKDAKLAEAICEGIYEVDPGLILLGLSGSEMLKAAEKTGLRSGEEVFAEPGLREDGSLVGKKQAGRNGSQMRKKQLKELSV